MITFKEYILTEGKVDDLKNLYQSKHHMNDKTFNDILTIDATPTKKYLQWMLKRYVDPKENHENMLSRFKEYIPKFDKLLNKKRLKPEERDIQRYKKVEQLYDVLKHYDENEITKSSMSKGVKNFKTDIDKKDVVFENDKVVIVVPRTEEKSCKYGAGTKWCTAARGHMNYFSHYFYDSNVTLYYILPKDKSGKIAVAMYDNGNKKAFDNEDHSLSTQELNKYLKNLDIPEF